MITDIVKSHDKSHEVFLWFWSWRRSFCFSTACIAGVASVGWIERTSGGFRRETSARSLSEINLPQCFDSRNRLAAGNTAYRYDAENQRTAVSVDGQETRYVINAQPLLSQLLVRTQPDGTQTYYVYGLGLIGQEKPGQYLTFNEDFRGSTVALTDETGQVTEHEKIKNIIQQKIPNGIDWGA